MQQRSEETRSNILASALILFAREGFDATGVAEICHAAGVSKGAFYHHFASKQEVFLVLLQDWLAGLDDNINQARQQTLTVAQALLKMTAMFEGIFVTAADHLPMFLEFWRQASLNPEIWSATVAPYRRYEVFFAELVEKGIAEGSLKPVDPHIAARTIVSLAVGILLQGLLDPHGADWSRVAQRSVQLLLDGLKKE